MKLVLLGPPGAGKGTQAKFLVEELGLVHISTGDIFRSNIKEETDLGKQVKAYLAEGKLVPDELTIAMVWDRLDQDDLQNGYLLDGFPRTIAQAEALDQGLEKRGQELDAVICINVPNETLIQRLAGRRVCPDCGSSYHVTENPPKKEGICDSCGAQLIQREDDSEETVRERITVYDKQTKPLVDYYKKEGKLLDINGDQDVALVTEDIRKALKH